MLAKEEILKACHALDIEADTEVIGEGWRADVLVDHDGKTMAFEVQLSIQSFAETIIRQKHFKESNVIGFWLFKNEQLPQKELRYVQEIPSFEIFYRKMDNQFRVFKNRGRSLLHISLKEFIQGILLREIRFSHFLDRVIDVTPRFTEVECLKCNNISHVLSYRAYDTSRCGYRSRYNENEEQTAYPNSPLKESIAEALLNYTIENAPSNIKPNLGICPFCETELYIWFSYSNGRIIRQFTDDNFKFRFKYIDRTGHWCIPLETGNFCDAHLPI